MYYRKYEGYTKTYVVQRLTGNGVMEDNYVEHEICYETDSLNEAKKICEKLTIENNSAEEIKSTWLNNTYTYNINTLSKTGQFLLEEFEKTFNNKIIDKSKYNKVTKNGITFFMQKFKP